MKYINLFNNIDEYNSAELYYPNVSLIEENQTIIYKMEGDQPSPEPEPTQGARGLRFESASPEWLSFKITNWAQATVTITNDNGDILAQFTDTEKYIDQSIHNEQPFWVTTNFTEEGQFGDYSRGEFDSVQYFNIEATFNSWNVSGKLADLMAVGADTSIQMSTVNPNDYIKLCNIFPGNIDVDFSGTRYTDWWEIAM